MAAEIVNLTNVRRKQKFKDPNKYNEDLKIQLEEISKQGKTATQELNSILLCSSLIIININNTIWGRVLATNIKNKKSAKSSRNKLCTHIWNDQAKGAIYHCGSNRNSNEKWKVDKKDVTFHSIEGRTADQEHHGEKEHKLRKKNGIECRYIINLDER